MSVRDRDIVAGRFEILARAGSGGMGTVFRALDRTSGETVALKVLHDDATDRFDRETETLAQLADPGIVRYVTHGHFEGAAYLAMEWLEGEDLETRLATE